jgi:lipoate-protein ligase B
MSSVPQTAYVLSDIEARQDAVIKQLEDLENRIVQVLSEYGVSVTQTKAGRPMLRVVCDDAPLPGETAGE